MPRGPDAGRSRRALRRPGAAAGDLGSDEAALRAYLLGKLAEPERSAVEVRLLADGYFFEAASAIEGDLLADYAAGALDAADAGVVSRWLAASTEIRRRFELIVGLGGIAAGEGARQAGPGKPAARDRQSAEALWERIAGLTSEEQRQRVVEDGELWTWALSERVCAESVQAAADNAQQALELAHLAVAIAERAPGGAAWRARLAGYAKAFEANALRVANDLLGAEASMAHAFELWGRGAGGDPERLLGEWEPLAVLASLRREQRRFAASLEACDLALSVAPKDKTADLLVRKALALEGLSDCEGAVAALRQAARAVDSRREPRLSYCVDFNLAVNLWHLGRSSEANQLLPRIRKAAKRSGNDLDLLRVRWLEARIAAGLGETQRAVTALEEVRRGFDERLLPFDAALAALDLALLYREQQRWPEIRGLAEQMLEIFRSQGIRREALAAVTLFGEAAQGELVSVELIRSLQDRLRKDQSPAPQL